MLLALGPHQFDITHRAVVMGVVDHRTGLAPDDLLRDAAQLVGQGAQALTLGRPEPVSADDHDERGETDQLVTAVAALSARFDQPLVVRTGDASVARVCFAAGAVAAHDDSGDGDPDYLAAVASAGATVVVGDSGHPDELARRLAGRARDAGAAGLGAGRIVLDPGVERRTARAEAVEQLRNLDCITRLGWPVLLSTAGDHVSPIATFATGVARGARILRTRDVRAARRVAEVAARLLRARDGFEDRMVVQ